jgi:hypothetical protein
MVARERRAGSGRMRVRVPGIYEADPGVSNASRRGSRLVQGTREPTGKFEHEERAMRPASVAW